MLSIIISFLLLVTPVHADTVDDLLAALHSSGYQSVAAVATTTATTTTATSSQDQTAKILTLREQVIQLTKILADLIVQKSVRATSTPEMASVPSVETADDSDVPTGLINIGASDTSTHGDVSRLQRFLKKAGDYTGEVTGYYGPVTRAAVEHFQTRNGIVSAGTPATTGFGVVGSRTLAVMRGEVSVTDVAGASHAWYTEDWVGCRCPDDVADCSATDSQGNPSGFQSRVVTCADADKTAVADGLCTETKPPTMRLCAVAPVATTTSEGSGGTGSELGVGQ